MSELDTSAEAVERLRYGCENYNGDWLINNSGLIAATLRALVVERDMLKKANELLANKASKLEERDSPARYEFWRNAAAESDGVAQVLAAENMRLRGALQEFREALKWFVDNDDTNQGDTPLPEYGGKSWNEINAHWIAGLNRAHALLEGDTP
jgi:hypothetical protein